MNGAVQAGLLARFCPSHGVVYSDAVCPQCLAAQQQRDAINVLEARVADLTDEIRDLRQRVAVLEHRCTSNQTAHNNLVVQVDEHGRRLDAGTGGV